MTDETVQPDVNTEATPATVQTPVETTPTVADIARKYNLTEKIQDFTAKPTPATPQVETRFIPNPDVDPEGYQQYQAKQEQQRTERERAQFQRLSTLEENILSIQRKDIQAGERRDIDAVVKTVNEKVNLDSDLIEAALHARALKDDAFQTIWDNRHRNPKALDEAIGVIANELAIKFAIKPDQKLTADVSAMKQAARGNSNTPHESSDENELLNLPSEKFLRKFREMNEG